MTPRPDNDVLRARLAWRNTGARRPDFAQEPGPDQESVWDYPRPPAVVRDGRLVRVVYGTAVIAETRAAVRVLETASPPTFYLPPDHVNREFLRRVAGSSVCEWKGQATYWALDIDGDQREPVGWSYEQPYPEFVNLAGFLSFYPGRIECTVDGERVRPQAGGFYGGWITDEVVGPFKGDPGTGGW